MDSDDDNSGRGLGWLGEVSEDDLQRSQGQLHDVYAAEEPEEPRILEAQVVRAPSDPEITRLLLLGCYLLLGSTAIQALRAESLSWPAPPAGSVASAAAAPSPEATTKQPRKEEALTAASLPHLTSCRARSTQEGRVQVVVDVANTSSQASRPAELTVHFTAEGETLQIRGQLPTLTANQQVAIPLDTPFHSDQPIEPEAGSFVTREGAKVEFWATIGAAP